MTIKPLSPLILSAALLFSACGAESGNNASKADLQQKLGAFEKKLETMKTLPDGPASAKQQLSNLMKMGKGAPDPIGQFVVEAVCAGLVSIDANDLYAKIRPSLRDIQSFENEVLETCPACSGTGGSSVECLQCHGSGKCPIPSCEDGKREVPSLAGSSGMVVSCSTCKGTGKCPTCQGKGEHPVRCSKCHGTRRVINKNAARELYQLRIAAAIAECQSKQGKNDQPVPAKFSTQRTSDVAAASQVEKTSDDASDDIWSNSGSKLVGNYRTEQQQKTEGHSEVFSAEGLVLSLEDMAKALSKWHDGSAKGSAPYVSGDTLEFPSRLMIGSFDIPLEKQSRRLSFDFRSNGTTGEKRGYTTIHLFTCDAADGVFIRIKDDGVFVESRRETPDKTIKASNLSPNWKHVDAEMKSDKVVITINGKRIVFPAFNGIRWARIDFTIGKPNLLLKNVKTLPNENHYRMAKLYFEGFRQQADDDPDVSRGGVQKVLKAAENGLAEAQFTYAALASGFGDFTLPQNEIFQWWLKAALQGHTTAQKVVGDAYLSGKGVQKDESKAYAWYLKSAESRNYAACILCGALLIHGEEIPTDYMKARLLLISALADEEKFSTSDKAILYELLAETYILPDDETKDIQAGIHFLTKAIQCGSSSARRKLNELQD